MGDFDSNLKSITGFPREHGVKDWPKFRYLYNYVIDINYYYYTTGEANTKYRRFQDGFRLETVLSKDKY